MYAIVRRDLSPVQQCVQSAHSIAESARTWPKEMRHPNFVLCGCDSESELERIHAVLESGYGIRCHAFREPDLGGTLTAISTEPDGGVRRKLSRLKLLPEDMKGLQNERNS